MPQEYLPAALRKKYYKPKEIGCEKNIKRYLQKLQTLIENSKPLPSGMGKPVKRSAAESKDG